MNDDFKFQLIAIQALQEKYGFCPSPQQVKLLESDGEGTYILFRIEEHKYRCDDGEITNIEEKKKLDEEIASWMEISRRKEKELMLTEAYNAKRAEIENLKGEMRFLKSLADDRMKEIERLEGKLGEMKIALRFREMDLDKAAFRRSE